MTATADVYDERGEELASLPLQMRSFGAHGTFDGPVRTVRCFQDNALVKQVLSTDGAGAVLVVDGGGSLETALVGDIIAGLAVANGWVGIVANGAIRDSTGDRRAGDRRQGAGHQPAQERQDGSW